MRCVQVVAGDRQGRANERLHKDQPVPLQRLYAHAEAQRGGGASAEHAAADVAVVELDVIVVVAGGGNSNSSSDVEFAVNDTFDHVASRQQQSDVVEPLDAEQSDHLWQWRQQGRETATATVAVEQIIVEHLGTVILFWNLQVFFSHSLFHAQN